jgi:hypothetical protein
MGQLDRRCRRIVQQLNDAVQNRDSDALNAARGELMLASAQADTPKVLKDLHFQINHQCAFHRDNREAVARAIDGMKPKLGL